MLRLSYAPTSPYPMGNPNGRRWLDHWTHGARTVHSVKSVWKIALKLQDTEHAPAPGLEPCGAYIALKLLDITTPPLLRQVQLLPLPWFVSLSQQETCSFPSKHPDSASVWSMSQGSIPLLSPLLGVAGHGWWGGSPATSQRKQATRRQVLCLTCHA